MRESLSSSLEWVAFTSLAEPKRNLRDGFFPKAVLETVEDFFPAVADDFTQPHAAVHGYE